MSSSVLTRPTQELPVIGQRVDLSLSFKHISCWGVTSMGQKVKSLHPLPRLLTDMAEQSWLPAIPRSRFIPAFPAASPHLQELMWGQPMAQEPASRVPLTHITCSHISSVSLFVASLLHPSPAPVPAFRRRPAIPHPPSISLATAESGEEMNMAAWQPLNQQHGLDKSLLLCPVSVSPTAH